MNENKEENFIPTEKTKLPDALLQVFSKEELEKAIQLKKIQENWNDIVGDILANESYPMDLVSGKLYILTTHSAYSQEIQFMSLSIYTKLENLLKKKIVHKLLCKVGQIPTRTKKLIPKIRKNKTLEGKEELIQILSKIADENLKRKLYELILVLDPPSQSSQSQN